MNKLEGEGNREDGEGQRGELLPDGRGRTSGESICEQDTGSRVTKLYVPFSIFTQSRGTGAGTAATQLMITE